MSPLPSFSSSKPPSTGRCRTWWPSYAGICLHTETYGTGSTGRGIHRRWNPPESIALAVPGSWTANTIKNGNISAKGSKASFYLTDITELKDSSRNYFGQQ